MTRRAPTVVVLLVALAAVAVAAVASTSGTADPPPRGSSAPAADLRTTVLLLLDCRSDIGRREITLFANGTVRLRQGPADAETMRLAELAPEILAGYRARLAEEDLSEVEAVTGDVEGEWVERCLLELPPLTVRLSSGPWVGDEPEVRRYTFSRYSVLPHPLSRIVAIAEELADEVRLGEEGGFPEGYRPRRGDVVERSDGVLFEVVGVTRDQGGVELSGLDVPLVVYVPIEALRDEFVSLVRRRGERP